MIAWETRRKLARSRSSCFVPAGVMRVLAHLTAGVGHGRRGLDPPFEEQLLQSGIERPFLDAQLITGKRGNALRDGVAMKGLTREDSQNQQYEGSGRQAVFSRHS